MTHHVAYHLGGIAYLTGVQTCTGYDTLIYVHTPGHRFSNLADATKPQNETHAGPQIPAIPTTPPNPHIQRPLSAV